MRSTGADGSCTGLRGRIFARVLETKKVGSRACENRVITLASYGICRHNQPVVVWGLHRATNSRGHRGKKIQFSWILFDLGWFRTGLIVVLRRIVVCRFHGAIEAVHVGV